MLDTREPANAASGLPEAGESGRDAGTRAARTKAGGNGNVKGAGRPKGLKIPRLFTREGRHPFDEIEWDRRDAAIKNDKGETIFEEHGVEVPKSWSMLATNIVASKYFCGGHGSDKREKSVRQLVHRVASTIAGWGMQDGYFETQSDADAFCGELCHLCANQYAAFNSPVWFNVGLHQVNGLSSCNRASFAWDFEKGEIAHNPDSYKRPQASACFIQAVRDTMDDIMRVAGTEAMLFKYGSGTGTDLSTLRSTREKLSGGGTPSGPISFMRVFDQIAAVVKSGGKTRRAAKMQSLKADHPDIMEFIRCKVNEEKKARALVKGGFDGTINGEAYASVMFQNSNLSVRVPDEFMNAVLAGTVWHTHAVTTGEIMDVLDARAVMKEIAGAAHMCGDPGLQYDTTINRWHTCPNSGRINASNPCSEYMFVDDSACNLASMNLMKFTDEQGAFDAARFRHAVRIMIIAQDILVDASSYPTREIALNSHRFRPLGLGYANLGALIMRLGLPYDSAGGRAYSAAVTALLTGYAYEASAELAAIKAPFDEYPRNREAMLDVLKMHRQAADRIDRAACPPALLREAAGVFARAIEKGESSGFRNAQATVLAPTGTIGFMMDCDTTGVEPDIALVKYKQMADGGMFKLVNRSVQPALERLGYKPDQIGAILKHIQEQDTIEGAPGLAEDHLPVFDCAFRPRNGKRFIGYRAHLKMMAAVQPFLSGAISKTVNMPAEATPEDIMQVYIDGWKLGLKAVAIYRDGSKGAQPVSTGAAAAEGQHGKAGHELEFSSKPFRRRMPATRQSITHKFDVAGHQGYLTVGLYDDGSPGELFITMAKEGSTVGGTMDAFGTAISLCLQYGVPSNDLVEKFMHSRFEPSGFTKNAQIPFAKSIVDYIFHWLSITFPDGRYKGIRAAESEADPDGAPTPSASQPQATGTATAGSVRLDEQFKHFMEDAPVCDHCGAITVRNGSCYRCFVCGNSMGCS